MHQASHFLPKTKYLQDSIGAEGRVCLAVMVDSIGMEKTIELLMEKLGIQLPGLMRNFLRGLEKRKSNSLEYKQKPEVKRKRAKNLIENLKKEKEKQLKDQQKI